MQIWLCFHIGGANQGVALPWQEEEERALAAVESVEAKDQWASPGARLGMSSYQPCRCVEGSSRASTNGGNLAKSEHTDVVNNDHPQRTVQPTVQPKCGSTMCVPQSGLGAHQNQSPKVGG